MNTLNENNLTALIAAALEEVVGIGFVDVDFTVMFETSPEEEDAVEELGGQIEAIQDFKHAGLMTNDEGLVIRTKDGAEYQLTVLRRC